MQAAARLGCSKVLEKRLQNEPGGTEKDSRPNTGRAEGSRLTLVDSRTQWKTCRDGDAVAKS